MFRDEDYLPAVTAADVEGFDDLKELEDVINTKCPRCGKVRGSIWTLLCVLPYMHVFFQARVEWMLRALVVHECLTMHVLEFCTKL